MYNLHFLLIALIGKFFELQLMQEDVVYWKLLRSATFCSRKHNNIWLLAVTEKSDLEICCSQSRTSKQSVVPAPQMGRFAAFLCVI